VSNHVRSIDSQLDLDILGQPLPVAHRKGLLGASGLFGSIAGACDRIRGFGKERAARWSAQGFHVVLDQGLFAVSNLLVNVFLARTLSPSEYGAFVTSYTVLLIIGVVHTGFLTDPLLIFGSGRYRPHFPEYFRVVRRYHWRMMAASSVLLTIAALALAVGTLKTLAWSLGGLAVSVPFVLLSWLTRRACHTVTRPHWAACGGIVYIVLCVAGSVWLSSTGLLSAFTAQVLLGGAALVASACMMIPLGRLTSLPLDEAAQLRVWPEHTNYGRWVCASGLVNAVHSYLFYFTLPIVGGLGATGSLKAASNLIMPILQSDGALITLATPVLVRNRDQPARFARLTGALTVGFTAEALLYGCALVIMGSRFVDFVYGGAYQYETGVLIGLAVLPLLHSNAAIVSAALRARNQPEAIFWSAVAAGIGTVVGLGMTAVWGVPGAVAGWILIDLTRLTTLAWFLRKPEPTGEDSCGSMA
jgi:O-antigen/teichoic acid export membrane protein